jgi:hypothetical protein
LLYLALGVIARAEDWTLPDGTIYKNVKVVSHDDGYVTITDSGGNDKIPLRILTPDLQNLFGYDPDRARKAEEAQAAADQAQSEALAAQNHAQAAPGQAQVAAPRLPLMFRISNGFSPMSSAPPYKAAPSAPVQPATPPASNKPVVDVQTNNAKIEDDEQALDSVNVDIGVAQRDVDRDQMPDRDQHSDQASRDHPNHVGITPEERMATLQKKKAELEAEIAELKKENASAGSP